MADSGLFIWDEKKRAANIRKHGVDFAACERFNFAMAATVVDDRRNYGEVRYRALGPIAGRLHAVVYTRRGDQVRIISMRKANAREIENYAQHEEK